MNLTTNQNSRYLRHERCPDCAKLGKDTSGDNLAVYDDGHKFCYSCGYYEGISFILSPAALRIKEEKKNSPKLPEDVVDSLPSVARDWITGYGINLGEASKNNFKWSQSRKFLIMPVYDQYGNLLLWQGRNFGASGPKYYTIGEPDKVLNIIGEGSETVVLVEDVLSAIKVGRVQAAMPLYGSNLSSERALRIASKFKNIIIWLDNDKADFAIKARQKHLPYFDNIGLIIRPFDPKQYSTSAIKGFVDNFSWR